jgi:transcriptional regulator with XRE-family HTH domain
MKSIFSDEYQIFIDFIKLKRTQKGLTQLDLANKLGVTQSFISKCERGERRLDLIETRKIANAIGIQFSALILELESELSEAGK